LDAGTNAVGFYRGSSIGRFTALAQGAAGHNAATDGTVTNRVSVVAGTAIGAVTLTASKTR
jgi:hypothetical protein